MGKSLAETEAWAKGIRKRTPDLVVASLPGTALHVDSEEAYIRRASWIVNWSLPFGPHGWTTVGVCTSSREPDLTPAQRHAETLFGEIVAAHDLPWLHGASAQDLLRQWLAEQIDSLPPRPRK